MEDEVQSTSRLPKLMSNIRELASDILKLEPTKYKIISGGALLFVSQGSKDGIILGITWTLPDGVGKALHTLSYAPPRTGKIIWKSSSHKNITKFDDDPTLVTQFATLAKMHAEYVDAARQKRLQKFRNILEACGSTFSIDINHQYLQATITMDRYKAPNCLPGIIQSLCDIDDGMRVRIEGIRA